MELRLYKHVYVAIFHTSLDTTTTYAYLIFIIGIGQSCIAETDTIWGIEWQQTNVGVTAVQKCPGLAESAGKILLILMTHAT